jgi:hypothetical protein
VRGPWLLRVMVAALEGRAYLVAWTDVEQTDGGFTVDRPRAELQRLAAAYREPAPR